MKILLVSWSILPRPGGSSIIVENLAQNFQPEELVVFGGRGLWQKPLSRIAGMPKFIYFFSEFNILGRGDRFFAGLRKWRFRSLVEKIKSVIREERIDQVIGVFPDALYCEAAARAALELGVPFSAYFHNTYLDNAAIRDPRAESIQNFIFEQSQHIFVMSKGMQELFQDNYGLTKVSPLVHTHQQLPEQEPEIATFPPDKEHFRLVAIGNFNESNIEATVRLARAISQDTRFSLDLYTHVPALLLRQRGLHPDWYNHRGFIAPGSVHGALQDYDICVLTHGFTGGYGETEYRTIFPTRTIPLLLSGKPILAHSPPGSFLNDFIRENQCAELVDQPEAEAIIRGLEKIINDPDHRSQLVRAASQTAVQFYGPEVVKKLKNTLQEKVRPV
ncbi:glycosyltransferase [Flavilitoribacter nigricans]|uniref:Glycosyltransferase subfamily 4-like N-terminal domain-containing protein n=1 Tax=Flavilitoribacter nigricans (strain ATCC 23147 / DSM 23189 / NBRC 102662 / NCIMB 1420 / SS-2) TaxID=1122177 RepID=A0A2D0NLH2_FLAN2|nr:glycosyltransferase [Flavilitoribacter nigricans]PHN08593.1 hypothetical protein CRP01_01390 [Flavilitoribacter nigricans DSM 23189 = NBRC 102662]